MTFRYTPRPSRNVAIVGSRHLTDYRQFCRYVRPLIRAGDVIVSGDASGIDSLAKRFAAQNGHSYVGYPPDPKLIAQAESEGLDRRAAYGRAAYARNQQIVDHLVGESDIMIAIACPHSRGTPDTIARMSRRLRNMGVDPKSTQGILYLYNWLWSCDR